LELLVAVVWSSRLPFAGPGSHLQVQVAMWRSRVPFGGPGGRLEVQVAVWSSRWPRGAPSGSLELQCGPGGLPGCGGLWRAVGPSLAAWSTNVALEVCRAVAGCGALLVPPFGIRNLYS